MRMERRVCSACLCPLEIYIMISSRGQYKEDWLPLPLSGYDLYCDCKVSHTNML